MLRSHRAWFAVTVAVALAACSNVKFAYNQLDWFVPQYLEGYVALDDMQSKMLKGHMADLLQWHCGTQLPTYAGHLREMNADFQNGRTSFARLAAHHDQIFDYWQAIKTQAAPAIATLLATATDEQLDELFASLEKANEKFKAEHVDRPESALRKAAAKTMRERLESWIGDLTSVQQQALAAWSEQLTLNGAERLQFRRHWQQRLRDALDRRDDRARFTAAVTRLIVYPQRDWSAAYKAKYDRIRSQTLTLLVQVGRTLEPAQHEYLARRADNWAGDFEQLACAPKAIRITSATRAPITAR